MLPRQAALVVDMLLVPEASESAGSAARRLRTFLTSYELAAVMLDCPQVRPAPAPAW
jgi:hypothetical protein